MPTSQRRAVRLIRRTAGVRKVAGFTLLEVLLAASLGVLVFMAVAAAINIYSRVFDVSRNNVEEAQLARTLLTRIADDLRGAIQYDPIQADKLMSGNSSGGSGSSASGSNSSSSSGSSSSSSTSDSMAGSDTSDSTDSSSTDDSLTSDTTNSSSDLSSSIVGTTPGLYGNDSQLQVDVSRLPRIDQLEAMMLGEGDSPSDQPSDVKTVTYFAIPPDNSLLGTGDTTNNGSGLIRRELDRAVTSFATQQGGALPDDPTLLPFAPEVNTIQFSYFDGSQWLDQWDSSSQGKLPAAIQVTICITPALQGRGGGMAGLTSSDVPPGQPDPAHTYSLLVRLPSAQPPSNYGSAGSSDTSSDDTQDQTSQPTTQPTAPAETAAPSPTTPAAPAAKAPAGGAPKR